MKCLAKVLVAFVLGILTVPLLVAGAAWLGAIKIRATDQAPRWEEAFAGLALDAALKKETKGLKVPLAYDDQALLAGLRLYRNNCAGCHGDFKAPSPWGSKDFYPRVPQFSDRPPDLSVPEMYLATKYGIRYSGMGAWNGMMPDEDIWRVSMFLGRLGSLPPEVDSRWRKNTGASGG